MEEKKLRFISNLCMLRSKALKAGLTSNDVEKIMLSECSEAARTLRGAAGPWPHSSGDRNKSVRVMPATLKSLQSFRILLLSIACVVIAAIYSLACGHATSFLTAVQDMECILDVNEFVLEISRPLDTCKMCEGISSFPTYRDMSPEEFLEKHAYTARPALIVEGGTQNWTALDSFSFNFFRDLYINTENALDSQRDCQFFPYNTDFETFEEFLNMSNDRASMQEDQWYVGWSNCDVKVAAELRRHYSFPHFLPEGAESSAVDWIFMGGPGLGANIHIDNVDRPSWQAQIRGSKTWTLIPPPECEHVCQELKATMTKGNVIVVDTNKWYHKTDIHPGEISITIGSEYD